MVIVIIGRRVIPVVTFVVLLVKSGDILTTVLGVIIAFAIGFWLSYSITTTLGQDYEIYLADKQPICTLSGEETYIQSEGNTYYYYTEDVNGKHKNSITSEAVYIIDNADAPAIKTYMRKYEEHWYSVIPDDTFDHYEICIPGTNQS